MVTEPGESSEVFQWQRELGRLERLSNSHTDVQGLGQSQREIGKLEKKQYRVRKIRKRPQEHLSLQDRAEVR